MSDYDVFKVCEMCFSLAGQAWGTQVMTRFERYRAEETLAAIPCLPYYVCKHCLEQHADVFTYGLRISERGTLAKGRKDPRLSEPYSPTFWWVLVPFVWVITLAIPYGLAEADSTAAGWSFFAIWLPSLLLPIVLFWRRNAWEQRNHWKTIHKQPKPSRTSAAVGTIDSPGCIECGSHTAYGNQTGGGMVGIE